MKYSAALFFVILSLTACHADRIISFNDEQTGAPIKNTSVTTEAGTNTFNYDPATQFLIQEIHSGIHNAILKRSYDAYQRPTGYALIAPAPAGHDPWSTSLPPVITAATYTYDLQGNFHQVQGETVPASLTAGVSTTTMAPFNFTYGRLANSSLVAAIVSPVHTVTNTYETNRNVLTQKQNQATIGANANAIVSKYDYAINAIGQRTARTQSGTSFAVTNTDNFTYNPRREVINSANTQNPLFNRSYAYDPIGNRLNATEGDVNNPSSNPSTKTYTSNSLNQYTQINTTMPSVENFIYDDDGNMLSDGTGKIYAWDCENRLIQVTLSNGKIIKYYYDSGSRRIRREHINESVTQATNYFYNDWNVIEEKTTLSNSALETSKTYVWGMDISHALQGAGGVGGLLYSKFKTPELTRHSFHTYDANGNTSELLDESASIQTHYAYDVFGRKLEPSPAYSDENTYGFSTKPRDELCELDYYGYRFYNPVLGRWLNKDPMGEFGGINLYLFTGNNSIDGIDVLGLWKRVTGHTWKAQKGDTLTGLAAKREYGGKGINWSCLWPIFMKKPEKYPEIQICDVFDASNLALKTWNGYFTLSVSQDIKKFSNTVVGGDKVPGEIKKASEEGGNPLKLFILEGHGSGPSGGDNKMGGAYVFDPQEGKKKRQEGIRFGASDYEALEDPEATYERASQRKGPKRCWFARDAEVRFAGCYTFGLARNFAGVALRRPAKAYGTTAYVSASPSGIMWGYSIKEINGAPQWDGQTWFDSDWRVAKPWTGYTGKL